MKLVVDSWLSVIGTTVTVIGSGPQRCQESKSVIGSARLALTVESVASSLMTWQVGYMPMPIMHYNMGHMAPPMPIMH